ncbi:hypothetical protein HY480_03825 [Candidatus Uhrbacteria bacterium]|nr:hypothetical protein [Candidatus Uhrbacteria bacterium]
MATVTGAGGGTGAPGTFQVKVSQMGTDTPDLMTVSPGETAGAVVRRAGCDPTGKHIRVNAQTVREDYVIQPTDGIIVVAPKIAAGK